MLLYLLPVLFLALYLVRKKYLSRTTAFRKIPGPSFLQTIGIFKEFEVTPKRVFENLNRFTKEYGPVFRIWTGYKLAVIFSDASYTELLIGSMKHLSKSSLYDFAEPLMGQGLLLSSGETWKQHRKIIAPTLGGKVLVQFLDVFNSNLETLIEKLSYHQNGSSFDIFPVMSLFTLDVVCECAMGVKLNCSFNEGSEYLKAMNCLEDAIFKRTFRPWLHPYAIFRMTSSGRQQRKYLPIIMNISRRVIQTRKQHRVTKSTIKKLEREGIERRTFLDHLLDQAEAGANLTDEDIQNEVTTIMATGHEKTAATLSYTIWLLAKHQDVQEKVVEELRSVFGSSLRQPVAQDVNQLRYLDQVIKESLRLFPPMPLFARRLTEDLITDKYLIPAGSEVGTNVYMLHRHPQYFPDPERFDPDRFLPENCAGRHPYAYIPFSAGPRNCVGYELAMFEMKVTLATLLRHFKILPATKPCQELDLTIQFILKSRNGVSIKLQHRNFLMINSCK